MMVKFGQRIRLTKIYHRKWLHTHDAKKDQILSDSVIIQNLYFACMINIFFDLKNNELKKYVSNIHNNMTIVTILSYMSSKHK